jgi:hypothetical protein
MQVPREKRGKGLSLSVSASSFVPKPFTPFQWEAQDTMNTLNEKQRFLSNKIRSKFIKFNYHDSEESLLEAAFARGDRRLGKVLIKAWEKGCKFDSWGEHFKYSKWMEAFTECGIEPGFYANRKRDYGEILPWDHVDIGVTKEFLMKESESAKKEELTPNCRVNCSGCGVTTFGGGICVE